MKTINAIEFYEAFSKLVKEKLNVDLDKATGINRIVCISAEEYQPSSLGPKFSVWVSSNADNEARGKDLQEMYENGIYFFGYATGSRRPVAIELDENGMPISTEPHLEMTGKPSGFKRFLYNITLHMLFRDEIETYDNTVSTNFMIKQQLMDFQQIALPQVELHESIAETAE